MFDDMRGVGRVMGEVYLGLVDAGVDQAAAQMLVAVASSFIINNQQRNTVLDDLLKKMVRADGEQKKDGQESR